MTDRVPQSPPWKPLAAAALQASIAGDLAMASRLLQTLHDRFGSEAVLPATFAFIDSMCTEITGKPTTHSGIELQFFDENGTVSGADGVTAPEFLWAGRFIGARFANDKETAEALVESCGEHEYSANIGAVLAMCGVTIREFRQGRLPAWAPRHNEG